MGAILAGCSPSYAVDWAGLWTPLTEQSWVEARTGWLAVGNSGFPAQDANFAGEELKIGGKSYSQGLGTYTPSEILYFLDGSFSVFEALVGVDDGATLGADRARFLIYVDGALSYDSGETKK